MKDARDIIKLWPSRATLAADAGLTVNAVHQWHHRNKLWPGERDEGMLIAAGLRGIRLTADDLVKVRGRG